MSRRSPFSSAGFEELILSVQRLAEMLEKTQLGKRLEWSETRTICGFFDAWQGEQGSIICRQGDHSGFVCFVCQGRVDIIKEDLQQNNKIIASLSPGNCLGEMSLIDGEPRSATAVVHSPVLLLVLTQENYLRLSEEYPRLWGKLVVSVAKTMSRRLRQTSGILAEYLEN